jgi:hypothetical protein
MRLPCRRAWRQREVRDQREEALYFAPWRPHLIEGAEDRGHVTRFADAEQQFLRIAVPDNSAVI